MKVNCNKCKQDFEIQIKTKYYYGIEVQYFICPYCNKKYTYAIIDNYIREKQKELNKFKKKVKECTNSKEINKLFKQQQRIIRDMKEHSDNFIKRLNTQ